ncbi:hypothetical protein AMATHDRAFT_85801 [Amanita thiersii Skay4041]|uniref:Uncharacterized protein n=1 Tax=Amanita thiersii Skay4041 TaxID=703135 RepID=A0A2A9NQ28_9AGAR|nr:hypothetical protein AMATHDRAFT_85801 [Amanita thiersii Skay4041]
MVFGFFYRKSRPSLEEKSTQETQEPPIEAQHEDICTLGTQDDAQMLSQLSLDPEEVTRTQSLATEDTLAADRLLAPVTEPSTLYALIRSVPAQVFHSYSLDKLSPSNAEPPSPGTLTALSYFFSTLTPPPRLHCVRCHKGYFDIENTDRSCLVPHDDESAEVERVSRVKGLASEYETLWGCCGRTVEGDGDMGPPDGWCYEGKHTTDVKRARFRADSTPSDDKLTPCSQLRCRGTSRQLLSPSPSSTPSNAERSRSKKRALDEDAEMGEPQSGDGDEKVSPKRRRRTKSTVVKRKSTVVMEAAETAEKQETAGKAEGKGDAMDVDAPPATTTPKPKSVRSRKSKTKVASTNEELGNESSRSSPAPVKTPAPKSRVRKARTSDTMNAKETLDTSPAAKAHHPCPKSTSPVNAKTHKKNNSTETTGSSLFQESPSQPSSRPHTPGGTKKVQRAMYVDVPSSPYAKPKSLVKGNSSSCCRGGVSKGDEKKYASGPRGKAKSLKDVVETSIVGEL